MMTTLTERAPKDRVGMVLSVMNSAAPVGAFLGPLLGGWIVDRWGFRMLLGFDGVGLILVIVALTFGYRDPFQSTNRGPIVQMAVDSVSLIWQSPHLRTIFLALTVLFTGWASAFIYVPLAVTALYHGTQPGVAVGVVLGLSGLVTLVLSPALGMVADRVGHWRVLMTAVAAEIVLWPIPLFAHTVVSFGIAWVLLNGVASTVFALSFAVLSSSVSSDTRGRIMSFAFLPINVGSFVGPTIGSVVAKSSVFAVFPLAAAITAVGLGILQLASRRAAVWRQEISTVTDL